jgi:TolB-like protein
MKQMQTASPKIKSIISLILLMIAFCCQSATADTAPQVKTDKDIYNTGETIHVDFFNAPGSQRDWICIVAAGSPDNDAGDYKYMPNRLSEGELTFDAPPPGKYEVRAFYNYSRNGYVVSARYSFSIVDTASSAKAVSGGEKMKPVESQVLSTIPAGSPKFNVAVFYFTPLSVDAIDYSLTVTNTLINVPKMQSSFVIMGRKDLEIFLSANNLQQNEQLDNIVEIGTKLGLNFVIAGNIGRRGSTIVTNCKVVSIAQRNIIYSDQFTSMGETDLINNVMKRSNSIIEAILRSYY